jgi:hypothetical protein
VCATSWGDENSYRINQTLLDAGGLLCFRGEVLTLYRKLHTLEVFEVQQYSLQEPVRFGDAVKPTETTVRMGHPSVAAQELERNSKV